MIYKNYRKEISSKPAHSSIRSQHSHQSGNTSKKKKKKSKTKLLAIKNTSHNYTQPLGYTKFTLSSNQNKTKNTITNKHKIKKLSQASKNIVNSKIINFKSICFNIYFLKTYLQASFREKKKLWTSNSKTKQIK